MTRNIDYNWRRKMIETVDGGYLVNETIGNNAYAKWLICHLNKFKVPFKVINLGAGVKRITTNTEVCSKCNGTGRSLK